MPKPSKNLLQPKWISIEDFEFICFNLAKELLEFNEPIPDYSATDISLLESSLNSPRNAYEFTKCPLSEQASILFYSLIKNHPFRNGNKRIAVMALLVFLKLNNKWLEIKPGLLYRVAVLVAESKPNNRELILKETTEIFMEFMIDSTG